MTVPRFVGNLILAIILICIIAALFAAGLGVAVASVWENATLGAEDGLDWAWLGEEPIHYTQVGPEEGTPIVLIHGYAPEGAAAWSASLPALAEAGLRVIAVDLRGFGYSSRDATAGVGTQAQAKLVADLMDNLGIQQATIVGHDWGCAVALQLAQDQPAHVQRLALIAPVLEPTPVSRWRSLLKTAPLGRALVLATTCAGPYWEATRAAGFHDATLVTETYLESAQQLARAEGSLEAMRLAALGSEGVDLKALGAAAIPPTLIVRGSDDGQLSAHGVEDLAKRLPGAQVAVIDEAGHWPQQEQAIRVVDTLVAWCASGG